MTRPMKVVLARPRGFCAGVLRAIEIVERALRMYGAPIYVRHEIVHNKHVVETLRGKGAIFVEDLAAVPPGALTIFSAHGVPVSVEQEAALRDLDVIDATCPLVRRVHREGQRLAARGYDVILIGHSGHPEVEGTRGQIDGQLQVVGSADEAGRLIVRDPHKVGYITQTTLSVRDTRDIIQVLKGRFPGIVGPDTRDICYATQNRQEAVLTLCQHVDAVLVVGSRNSSNSNRLREIAEGEGVPAYLIDTPDEVDWHWLEGVERVGITAGASAPEVLVQALIDALGERRRITVESLAGMDEDVEFRLPQRLVGAGTGFKQAAEEALSGAGVRH